MIKNTFLMFLLIMYPIYSFCDQNSDAEFRKEYPNLPIKASSIKVKRTLKGDFIEYYDSGNKKIFINNENKVVDVNEQIKISIENNPDFLDIANVSLFNVSHIMIRCVNSQAQAVGYFLLPSKGVNASYLYVPFLWSPLECKILPTLNESSCSYGAQAISINNEGIVVGYDYKTYKRTFYLGKSKKKKELLCREIVPVLWLNPNTIKEIELYLDPKDKYSYLGNEKGRPYWLTIDNKNNISFWSDDKQLQLAGSIHISELD